MRLTTPPAPRNARAFWSAWVIGLGLTIVTGVAYGHYAHRWGPRQELRAAADHLEGFPAEFGDWQLQSEEAIDRGTIEMLNCAGYINRRYVNRYSGETVGVAIIAGPPGPVSVHTPEICYSSRDYSIVRNREEAKYKDQRGVEHSFWSLVFESKTAFSDRLAVIYAWSDGGIWTASDSPRFEFAGAPALMKIQLAALTSVDGRETGADFLQAVLASEWSASFARSNAGN